MTRPKLYAPARINPMAIGIMNLVKLKSTNEKIVKLKTISVIMMDAGSAQMSKVMSASNGPPCLYPMAVIVCVEEGPGNTLHNAVISKNSTSDK